MSSSSNEDACTDTDTRPNYIESKRVGRDLQTKNICNRRLQLSRRFTAKNTQKTVKKKTHHQPTNHPTDRYIGILSRLHATEKPSHTVIDL